VGEAVFLQFENMIAFPFLFHVMTTKKGFPHPRKEVDRLKALLGIDRLYLPSQVHGSHWVLVDGEMEEAPVADALLVSVPEVCVGVLVADCVPLLVVDPHKRGLAVIHAGWRGILASIHTKVIQAMHEVFGSRVSDLVAGVGPAIGECCFEVGEDVAQLFYEMGGERHVKSKRAKFFIDLRGIIMEEWKAMGMREEHIEVSRECTFCRPDLFPSFRREREQAGRCLFLAGWKKTGRVLRENGIGFTIDR